MFKSVIFDLDGTLVDTEPAAAKAVDRCFARWQIKLDASDAGYVTGRTWDSAFEYLFKKYSLPLPLPPAEAGRAILDEYRESLKTDFTVVKGSVEAVKNLRPHCTLGLVSGSHREDIFFILNKLGIDEYFDIILGAEDYPQSKPAPDGYLAALKVLGVPAKNTLVFEDSRAGVQSALAAGTWVVAITGTNHYEQDTTGAHHKIPDLTPVNGAWMDELAAKLTQRT
jgi:beta-phosphoglucomutase-like phosphatase (HAD superfamily)